ncbi:Clp protease [Saccharopolyspora erythraea]|nr:Clp protease [Saccharopolyspora erythraea]
MTMFERFTRTARDTVVRAVEEAKRAEAAEVTAEHLALALLATPSGALLAEHGVRREDIASAYETARRRAGLSESDASALRELGIEVDHVVGSVEGAHGTGAMVPRRRRRRFGPRGHVPVAADTKEVLRRCLREALDMGDRQLDDRHLLLGLVTTSGVAADLLDAHGIGYAALRARPRKAS